MRLVCHLLCSRTDEDDPLRFAPGNLAAMKAVDLPRAFPVTESTTAKSTSSTFFGLFLSQQIPSVSAKAAASELQPEATLEADGDGSAAPLTSAGQESAGCSKSTPIAGQKSVPPAVEAPPTQPALTQRLRPDQQSTNRASDTAPSTEAESATVSKMPNAFSTTDVAATEAGIATPELAGATISGPQAAPAQVLAASAWAVPQAERAAPVRWKEQVKPAEEASTPRDRKSETGKLEGMTASQVPSSPIHVGGSPAIPLSAMADLPVSQIGVAAAQSPSLPVAAVASHGKLPARIVGLSPQASRGHFCSPLQPPAPPADQASAVGTPPNRSQETAGIVPQTAAGLRVATHNTQTGSAAAASPKTFEAPPSGIAATVDGQHTHPPAGPALAPIAGAAQFAQLPQVTGLSNSTVPAHPSAVSSDSLLRPAAAWERMDTAAPPRILESSPQNLAVGIRDAGLGWIEIRTHAVAGQVAATLASGTHEAHTTIVAELSAIRDSLTNEHVTLHSLSAERFPASSGGDGSASNTPDSGNSARQSYVKTKGETHPAYNEAEEEDLSYISVRV